MSFLPSPSACLLVSSLFMLCLDKHSLLAIVILTGVKWNIKVDLPCIFLMAKEVEFFNLLTFVFIVLRIICLFH